MILVATWEDRALGSAGRELMGAAARLGSALGTDVALAALGEGSAEVAAAAGGYGATRAFAFDAGSDSDSDAVEGEAALTALAELAGDLGARAVLLASDERGSELGPRLAERLAGAAVTHVLAVEIKKGGPVWMRPVFGGKALAAVRATREPVVATLRRGAFETAEATGGSVEVETRAVPAVDDAVELVEVAPPLAGIPLDQASVVVSGGRGLGAGDAFVELEQLASLLGGVVGASLAAVDAGWAPTEQQIGLTGKVVSPDLYFAIGISGASQHLAGIGGAKAVVAVNTDPDAPIFGVARLGVVMDCRQLLPALLDELRRRAPRA